MVRKLAYVMVLVVLASCGRADLTGFFVSPSDGVEDRFKQSMELTGGEAVAALEVPDKYSFYVCTDVHTAGSTNNFNEFISALRNDVTSAFGIAIGDVIDRVGMMDMFAEATEFDEAVHAYDRPFFAIPGNHDMYFSQWEDFKAAFGAASYYFEAMTSYGKDLFIALDSASGTLGLNQMNWLKDFFAKVRESYNHCMVFVHTNFFKTDNSQIPSGNWPLEETFALTELFDIYDVDIVFQGHDHHREDLIYRGVRYTLVGAIKDQLKNPEYLMVTMTPDDIEYDWVQL